MNLYLHFGGGAIDANLNDVTDNAHHVEHTGIEHVVVGKSVVTDENELLQGDHRIENLDLVALGVVEVRDDIAESRHGRAVDRGVENEPVGAVTTGQGVPAQPSPEDVVARPAVQMVEAIAGDELVVSR